MSSFLTIVIYVAVGLIAGIFGGLGMGGGTLLIPLLTIFFDLDQKLCQGINLVSFLVMAIFAILVHYKNGYIETKSIIYIIFSGLIFASGGAILANYISSNILKIAFGIFLCILSVIEVIKVLRK